jgi:glycosyltransferase involved in cell wall biosynthesis
MYRLVKQLQKTAEIYVACPKEEPYWSRFVQLLGADRLLEIPHRALSVTHILALRRFARKHHVALVHSHGLGAGLYSRPLGLLTGIPSIHTYHGVVFHAKRPLWTAPRWAAEWLLSLASWCLIAASNSEKAHLSKWLFPNGNKIKRVNYGVPASQRYKPRSLSYDNQVRIVWIGRMHEQKDPLQAVSIAKALKLLNLPKSFTLQMLGDGPLMSRVKDYVTSEHLEDVVELIGARHDPSQFFENNDILLSTSRWEGLPNCILEAMSFGLFVIASRVHGNVDIVEHGVTGLLFDKNSPSSVASLLINALQKGQWCADVCDTARTHVEDAFGMQRYGDDHMRLYEQCRKW